MVPRPYDKNIVGVQVGIYNQEYSEGNVERFKARLIANSYTRIYGVDYEETFAPVAKINTARTLISCAVNFWWDLFQLDVKNIFLYGDLKEEVCMKIPSGFENKQLKGKVCRLKRSLYGLKQSPRAWFDRFSMVMKKLGYQQSNADHTIFIRRKEEKFYILVVYVDDIVLTDNDPTERRGLK
jgi:Reverse transcriptase (RNA-dependent DNA polymerase)